MYTIKNNVEDKVIFSSEAENEFIHFTRQIAIENEDEDLSIISFSEAKDYLDTYCDNLDLYIGSNEYEKVYVWFGTVIGEDNANEFNTWFLEKFLVRVSYCEEVETLPSFGEEELGGRNDLFFRVHNDDIFKLGLIKITLGEIHQWDDIPNKETLYPKHILERYYKD